jgi:hypothetical protein
MTRLAKVLILVAIGAGCLIVLMAVWGPRRNHATMANSPTSEELEREIRAELPIGSSLSTVQGCLTKRELEFSFQTSSRTIVAIARKLPGSTAVVSKSFQLEFRFDDASKLKSIDAKVLYTGV